MKIRTNNHYRPVLYWWELTDAERADLDYVEEQSKQDDFRGFRYKGQVYDLGEFVAIGKRSENGAPSARHSVDDDSPLLRWHGIQTESYFSAIVVRYSSDYEYVAVGLATS